MSVKTTTLPKRYHEAVLRWQDVFLPDYDMRIALALVSGCHRSRGRFPA